MQKIVPHFWFDTEAKEATAFYVSLFDNSKINTITSISNTPSGDSDIVTFTLAGQDFMAISAGPYFKLNPAVSLFVVCESEEEIKKLWAALIDGGKALMSYDTYPWAQKYGWLQDRYGLSWQLSYSAGQTVGQKITPSLMFTKDKAGKAKEAIEAYVDIFPDSHVDMMMHYEKGEGDKEEYIKHARFSLLGQDFIAMDSSGPHDFTFNEAVSFVVSCATQEEIDQYWNKLSTVPEAEQCGWCKDAYGVSWQIVPSVLAKYMTTGDQAVTNRVTKAFMNMKKFDIAALTAAFEGKE